MFWRGGHPPTPYPRPPRKKTVMGKIDVPPYYSPPPPLKTTASHPNARDRHGSVNARARVLAKKKREKNKMKRAVRIQTR